jgi:hypothetical protein
MGRTHRVVPLVTYTEELFDITRVKAFEELYWEEDQ